MKRPIAMAALRWAVGLVVLIEALHFALSPLEAAHFARTGLPSWLRPLLAWPEAAAAVLFLTPRATVVGGCTLLLIFTAAVGVHVAMRDVAVGALVVYAAAVVACMEHRTQQAESRTP